VSVCVFVCVACVLGILNGQVGVKLFFEKDVGCLAGSSRSQSFAQFCGRLPMSGLQLPVMSS